MRGQPATSAIAAHFKAYVYACGFTSPYPSVCREAREQLAKSATAADYKAYEREQEVRRAIDEEITQSQRKLEVSVMFA